LKQPTASQVIMWSGLITVPPAIAWYVSSVQTIFTDWHAGPNSIWPDIFGFLALASFVTMILAIAVQQANQSPTGSSRIASIVGLNFRSSDIAPYISGLGYPRKLNVYLSNDGDDIHLGVAKWVNERVGPQAGMPPRVMYLLRNRPGGPWESESTEKTVPAGMWVKMWVGLDSTVSESDLTQWCKDRRLGIVEIPVTISGAAVTLRIPV
jgi:hypothetical protein